MNMEKSLLAHALDLLSRREYSQLELKRKLMPYAESSEEVEEVLAQLAARNWQSDVRFAETFIASKSRKHGSLRLKQELAMKGIEQRVVASLLPDCETELQHAHEVLRKKFKQPAQTMQEKQKQIRFLLYRGFSMDTVMKTLKIDWDE